MQITDLIVAIGCAAAYKDDSKLSIVVYITALLYTGVRIIQIWG